MQGSTTDYQSMVQVRVYSGAPAMPAAYRFLSCQVCPSRPHSRDMRHLGTLFTAADTTCIGRTLCCQGQLCMALHSQRSRWHQTKHPSSSFRFACLHRPRIAGHRLAHCRMQQPSQEPMVMILHAAAGDQVPSAQHAQRPSRPPAPGVPGSAMSGLWGCARAWVAQRLVALLALAQKLGSCSAADQAAQARTPAWAWKLAQAIAERETQLLAMQAGQCTRCCWPLRVSCTHTGQKHAHSEPCLCRWHLRLLSCRHAVGQCRGCLLCLPA